jgi:4-amino-4-deoxy-L-arabinose transferase-like glycosyltransferase
VNLGISDSLELKEGVFGPASWPAHHASGFASRMHLDPASLVLILIAATAILRTIFAIMLGLGIDESYMVASGRELQLSYFDHPPVSWWLQWGASNLFRSEMPVVVRLPFIALFAASTWLMYRITARLFSEAAGLWATVAFNLAPVFGFTSASWVLPDGPLDATLLGFMLCLVRALEPNGRHPWAWWLGTGLCAGLAMLSKYTASLVLLGAVIAVLAYPDKRRWLLRLEPWVAATLGVALFSPVIVWNAQHHWCSIAFQGGRALGSKWHPFAPLTAFGGEALYLLPWIWLPLMAALFAACRRGSADPSRWLLACSGTPTIVFFAFVGIWSKGRVLFHWAAPGYLVLFPLLGVSLERWAWSNGETLRRVIIATACLLVLAATIVSSEVRWNWLPSIGEDFVLGADPDLAAVNWASLLPEMRARGWIGPGKPIVAAVRWQDAGKVDYVLGGAATVICLGDDAREFGLIHPAAAFDGQDVLILAPDTDLPQVTKKFGKLFERIEQQPPLPVIHGDRLAMDIPVYLGRRLRVPRE